MKKPITKHLREKNLNAVTRKLFDVNTRRAEFVDLIDRRGVEPLHHHHGLFAPIPVHFGHVEERRADEVAAQL